MIALLSAVVAAAIVMVVAVLMIGWGGRLTRAQRIGLCIMCAGLAWAGPSRLLGRPIGLGDLLFVSGILVSLLATHGRAIWRTADGLDGVLDGRIGHRRWWNDLIGRICRALAKGPSRLRAWLAARGSVSPRRR